MNKIEKMALVPRLRFPEFRSTGGWKINTLSNLASKITVRNQENLINRVLTNSAVEGVVDQSDYFDREVANPNNLENYFVIDEGDYVYNPRISVTAPVGPISKNKVGRGVMSPLYTVFRFENPNNDFYEQYFKTNLWHAYLKSVSNTGARHDRMSISYGNFMNLPLPYPPEGEQQKIADCLSSLDDLIINQGKRLAALKAYKKGLMQKLFPAEGKTVPEYRFPEFRGSIGWKKTELGKLIEIKGRIGYRGYTTEDIVQKGEGAISLSPSNITDSGRLDFEKNTYISWSKYAESPEIMLSKGFTVLVKTGSSYGKVAYVASLPERATINPQIVVLKPLKIHEKFLFLLVSSELIQKQIKECAVGGAIPTLSQENISRFNIYVPQPQEQQKIADCLSTLDTVITAQLEEIEMLKSHKKGLMQGLFLSVVEVGE